MGRRRLDPEHVMTGAERQARWREKHRPPEEPDGPPELRTFGELAAAVEAERPRPPFFDPAALIG
jgi:hypothetical protein